MRTGTSNRVLVVLGMCGAVLLWGCTKVVPPDGKSDIMVTDTATTSKQTFAERPIPAGFFDFDGRSCESFGGEADFAGAALNQGMSGAADTIIWREEDPIAESDPIGTENTVRVQIRNLNLRATDPITVTCDGAPTEWHVQATLSDTASPMGTLTAVKTHANGGTAETLLPVLLKLTFTNVEQPAVTRTLDFEVKDWDAVNFQAEMAWVHRIDPSVADAASGFVLGVAGGPEAAKLIAQGKAGPRLQGGETLIACSEHVNPGGNHQHNTCAADSDGDGIPDGADTCRFLPNPDQEDRDGDTFGDPCDPCPDDPTCPDVDCLPGGTCDDLNEEMREGVSTFYDFYCEFFTSCFDYMTTGCEPSDRCKDLLGEYMEIITGFSGTQQGLMCVQARFMGNGCDRCPSLEPIAPPACLEELFGSLGASGAAVFCTDEGCPEGQECDFATGQCRDIGSGCEPWVFDPCEFKSCSEGQECQAFTGLCCDIGGECETLDFMNLISCASGTCEAGFVCEPSTQICWNPDTGECGEASFSDLGPVPSDE